MEPSKRIANMTADELAKACAIFEQSGRSVDGITAERLAEAVDARLAELKRQTI